MPTKGDSKRVFIVNVTRFGVLTNWQEVHRARIEGRSADAVPHYFSRGDKIALSDEYCEKFPIAHYFRESSLDAAGRPAIEPLELHEKRLANEARLAEASAQAGADAAKLDDERRDMQAKLQQEFAQHADATTLAEFSP